VNNQELTARWQGALMNNYGTPKLALVRGAGAKLWDADGNEYTDFVGGIAVNALGHAHPAIVEAVSRQIAELGHVSNLFIAEPPVALAERLLECFGRDGKVFFCNSGAEANEGAFKIGRLTGRQHMVATSPASPPSGSRSSRCPATSRTCPTATRRPSPPPSTTTPRSSSSSPSRARTGWSYRPPGT
jgi:acetylornithine/succinyldiaminopimelate/putrescine aminotransferase